MVFRFRRLREHIIDTFRRTINEPLQLKPGNFTMLALIEANPSLSQIDLARLAGFDQAVLVGIIDDLELNGWAVRKKHASDRRRHMIEITPEGRKTLKELNARVVANEAAARATLTAAEYAEFDRLLTKMYQNLI